MELIYSKAEPGTLLHIIHYKNDFPPRTGRIDICPSGEFIQCAAMNLHGEQTFKPHKHIELEKITTMAQESWIVVQGVVEVILYDLDDKIIAEKMLIPGDCSITFKGGHNYKALIDNTLVYEYKTGPYLGQEKDKVFI